MSEIEAHKLSALLRYVELPWSVLPIPPERCAPGLECLPNTDGRMRHIRVDTEKIVKVVILREQIFEGPSREPSVRLFLQLFPAGLAALGSHHAYVWDGAGRLLTTFVTGAR